MQKGKSEPLKHMHLMTQEHLTIRKVTAWKTMKNHIPKTKGLKQEELVGGRDFLACDLHWVQYLIANEALLDKQEK